MAPLFAAGLFVTAELAYWSLEERERVQTEPGTVLRRFAFVALLALGALIVAMLVLAVVDAVEAKGLALDVVGAAAAAAVLFVVVLVTQRLGRAAERRAGQS
jgi:polyferredoxin